jgi:hypothetical protein
MPQNTNLNVSPYFDDFDATKNYQKVLFKPGTPIQARELTTLQSILQNQVEKFGQHFFKEGAMVIPGQVAYDPEYTYVQLNENHLGIPISLYIDKFVGTLIKGEQSGVTAKIENFITNSESENLNYTLYIKYQSSSDRDFTRSTFLDGENLIVLETVDYGVSSVRENTTFASTILSNSTGTGCAAKIASGVYFVRGYFVNVVDQAVILDQYTNNPSYRVGLIIDESFAVASNDYQDLFDNAQGFSNFAAPGADRFIVSTRLIKKELEDFNDENFIELMRLENGILQKFVKESNYNLVRDELARRTYDESGDYYINPFSTIIKESLNDKLGNNGVYSKNQLTKQGNIPSDDIATISISPGKAYVRGYEVETISNTLLDIEKPRDTDSQTNQSISFNLGNLITLDNVHGSLPIGFTTSSQVSLYSNRTSVPGQVSGEKIGISKVYELKLRNAEYTGSSTKFEISLYDIQSYTKIKLNAAVTSLLCPIFVEGKSSGTTGYLVEDVFDSDTILLYQVSGSFLVNEQLKFNDIDDRTIVEVRDYSLSDVHQIVANENNSGIGTFTSDPILSNRILLSEPGSQFTISEQSAGVSTITTPTNIFYPALKVGDIISYTKSGDSVLTYNRISNINPLNNKLTITPTSSVSNVCDGTLPSSTITSNDVRKVTLNISGRNTNGLIEILPSRNISNLNLSNSSFKFKRSYNITISGNAFSQNLETDVNLALVSFDEEDYNLSYKINGQIETLDDQKLTISGRTINLQNLSRNGDAILTVSYIKTNTKNKSKIYRRSSVLILDKSNTISSGIGTNTLNDGLIYSQIYGLRVQDKELSLNVPDVIAVKGIFESSSTSDPNLPSAVLTALTSSLQNTVVGEHIIGSVSNAIASLVRVSSSSEIYFVYLNENTFVDGEIITFSESNIEASILSETIGDNNVKDNYSLDPGYKLEYLDFSKLIRKKEFSPPSRKLKIVYDHYTINEEDSGDFVSVNSYDNDRYKDNIPFTEGIPSSDVIDFRPRVRPYSGNKSPFEYVSRIFEPSTNSSPHIISKDSQVIFSYEYYIPRIDKLFLTKDGAFTLGKGISSSSPKLPDNIDFGLEIATIYLPAYLYDVKDVKIVYATHKRYTMKDISRLENRLSNIEFYTSLSLLESDTQNLTIRDSQTGLDRFKSGFFVDNFKSYDGGDISNPNYRASVDTINGILRPQPYSTSLDLLIGSESTIGVGTASNPEADLRWVTDLGSPNIKKIGDIVCLNYNDVVFFENRFATRIENVNPFNVITFLGSIQLNPPSDTWIETRTTQRIEDIEGSYQSSIKQLGIDCNTGLSPVDWNAWETNWTGVDVTSSTISSTLRSTERLGSRTTINWNTFIATEVTNFRDSFVNVVNETTTTRTGQSRSGTQFSATERFDTTNLGNRVVSTSIIKLMRSRNIEVVAKRLKPNTRFYAFFDSIDVTEYMVPKLIEVNMESGNFVPGETVVGTLGTKSIRFRLATQNHKYGPYTLPNEVYLANLYQPENILSTSYSSTTSVLNVDTASLEIQADSRFFGSISRNMKLVGETSGAIALVSELRLVSDGSGTILASLFIPDPTTPTTPSFESGTKTFLLTTSETNSAIAGSSESTAEASFTSSGTLNNAEDVTLRIRNAEIERTTLNDSRTIVDTETRTSTNTSFLDRTTTRSYVDPIAQSFEVTEQSGVYLTKCDLFFSSKDDIIPVTLQVREMQLGIPTQTILPFAEVVLDPKDVNISEDASVPTTFTFPAPVYLEGRNEYAFVLITASNSYNCWISRMGEPEISTIDLPESSRVIVSQQPSLGSFFKSQNGFTWDASQYEDLKIKVYKAQFTSKSSSFKLYNPNLGVGNRQIVSLRNNPITANSRSIIVGLGKSLTSANVDLLTPGSSITQTNNTTFSGNLKSIVGAIGIGSTLSITNSGFGFISTTASYPNTDLVTLTGTGTGAKVDLTVSNGVAIAATVSAGGFGYAIGDSLTINASNTSGFGKNLIISIPNAVGIISSFNSIIVDEVQGTPEINLSDSILSNGQQIFAANITSINVLSDGLHFKVNHSNHGMYSNENRVELFGIEPDVPPTKLTANLASNAVEIFVTSVLSFTTFENKEVAGSNPGYVIINGEIIGYTAYDLDSNKLTGIVGRRGVDDSVIRSHNSNNDVFKYEFNGVSLRRINKIHSLLDTDTINYPIALDSYHIKVNTNLSGTDRNNVDRLYFNKTKSGGSYFTRNVQANSVQGPKATQNIMYNILRPNIQSLLPETTSINARIRSITGTSVNGTEVSFIDKGFESVSLNSNNEFNENRLICSRINEINKLQSFPGNKSFTMELEFNTNDINVSPMIDLTRINIITSMNRIDRPVVDFTTDPRVNKIIDDPHSAVYVTKIVRLEKPADNIKVIFDAYRHFTNDIRVAYRLFRADTSIEQQLYELFPGFDNIDENSNIIDIKNNSGRPDRNILPSNVLNDFRNYEFTAKDLPLFNGFQVKIIMTGTDQAHVPLIRDNRVIATL